MARRVSRGTLQKLAMEQRLAPARFVARQSRDWGQLNLAGYFLKYGNLDFSRWDAPRRFVSFPLFDRRWYAEKGISVDDPADEPMITNLSISVIVLFREAEAPAVRSVLMYVMWNLGKRKSFLLALRRRADRVRRTSPPI